MRETHGPARLGRRLGDRRRGGALAQSFVYVNVAVGFSHQAKENFIFFQGARVGADSGEFGTVSALEATFHGFNRPL